MSDPNQQCPSNWNLITTPVRGCGRSSTEHLTCDSVFYPVNGRNYSSVCGRVLAYQRGESHAFFNSISRPGYNNIEFPYVSGISLTHGPAGNRQHIWTFAGALHEEYPVYFTKTSNCACTNTRYSWPYQLPSFIGNNYFCNAGYPGPNHPSGSTFYTDDPLWDGKGCGPYSTCCSFNTPPWFCKSLPQPTSDDLEIRLCCPDRPAIEDKLIFFLDIYIK